MQIRHTGWENRKNYGTLLSIPEQKCLRNLERFRQSTPLIKIPNALFPRSSSDKRSRAFVMINRADAVITCKLINNV